MSEETDRTTATARTRERTARKNSNQGNDKNKKIVSIPQKIGEGCNEVIKELKHGETLTLAQSNLENNEIGLHEMGEILKQSRACLRDIMKGIDRALLLVMYIDKTNFALSCLFAELWITATTSELHQLKTIRIAEILQCPPQWVDPTRSLETRMQKESMNPDILSEFAFKQGSQCDYQVLLNGRLLTLPLKLALALMAIAHPSGVIDGPLVGWKTPQEIVELVCYYARLFNNEAELNFDASNRANLVAGWIFRLRKIFDDKGFNPDLICSKDKPSIVYRLSLKAPADGSELKDPRNTAA
jgi:hypothetical protein